MFYILHTSSEVQHDNIKTKKLLLNRICSPYKSRLHQSFCLKASTLISEQKRLSDWRAHYRVELHYTVVPKYIVPQVKWFISPTISCYDSQKSEGLYIMCKEKKWPRVDIAAHWGCQKSRHIHPLKIAQSHFFLHSSTRSFLGRNKNRKTSCHIFALSTSTVKEKIQNRPGAFI